jgi:hypothetical protein
MRFASFCLFTAMIAGCSDAQTDAGEGDPESPRRSDAISVMQSDGVWLFTYDPEATADAGLSGDATVVDGCLVAGGRVVIWSEQTLPLAREMIEAIKGGMTVSVRLGGHETSEVPTVVGSRCNADSIWYCGREGAITSDP